MWLELFHVFQPVKLSVYNKVCGAIGCFSSYSFDFKSSENQKQWRRRKKMKMLSCATANIIFKHSFCIMSYKNTY